MARTTTVALAYVSNDKATDKHVIAGADGTAGAHVRQLRVG